MRLGQTRLSKEDLPAYIQHVTEILSSRKSYRSVSTQLPRMFRVSDKAEGEPGRSNERVLTHESSLIREQPLYPLRFPQVIKGRKPKLHRVLQEDGCWSPQTAQETVFIPYVPHEIQPNTDSLA